MASRQEVMAKMPQVQRIHAGWVYRGSDLLANVVNKRFAVISDEYLSTYRRETDTKPSKLWSLEGAKINPPKETECTLKTKGTSTVVALVASRYTKITLWGVKVQFSSADPLTLYSDTQAEAQEWYNALDSVASKANGSCAQDLGLSVSPTAPSAVESMVQHENSMDLTGTDISASVVSRVPKRANRHKWATLKHINGVAVYLEEPGENNDGGAIMASLVVRAPPAEVFEACRSHFGVMGSKWFEEIEQVSRHKTILKGHVRPGGWLRGVSAQREYVVAQTWRQDDEGTFVLLYQSVDHPSVPTPAPAVWDWVTPVRLNLPAAGLTIAPLQPRFRHDSKSDESLFTLVMKCEPGGWLGSPLANYLVGRVQLTLAFVEPFILTMIALRDRLEQERFVIQPLEFNDEEEASVTTLDMLDHTMRTKSLLQARLIRTTHEEAAEQESASTGVTAEAILAVPPARAWVDGTCDQQYWSCPGAAGFKVRGPNYFKDKKKVESQAPVFALLAVDLVRTQNKSFGVAAKLPSVCLSDAPFVLLVNLMIPGPPHLSLIFAWGAEFDPTSVVKDLDDAASSAAGDHSDDEDMFLSPVDRALARFVAGTDADRTNYFKLIPKVVQGGWVIKQAVGTTPVILGRKLQTTYVQGELEGERRYMEIDVDIGSSSAASSVVGLVQPATKSLVVDMAVLLEGRQQDELPEGLLGTVRIANVDLQTYKYLDVETGAVYPKESAPAEVLAWK